MLDNDINYAKKIINGTISNENFNSVYPFTNENIKACFDHFDFKGKDVLSVLASSDQVFDMFLRGAKTIHTFDINPLCKYYFDLKKAAIKHLDKEVFLHFLNTKTYYFDLFDYNSFYEILKTIKGDSYTFWNEVINKKYGNKIYLLFNTDYSKWEKLVSETLYLNDDNYKKLQTKIDELEIKFIKCNIYDLVNILDSKYDIMYLSNILGRLGFVQAISDKSVLNHFIAFLNSLSKYLKENGEIIANYYYDYFRINSLYKYLEKNKFDLAHFKDIKIEKSGALIYR